MHFAHVEYAVYLLLSVLIFILAYFVFVLRKKKLKTIFSNTNYMRFFGVGERSVFNLRLLRIIVILLLVIATMRPQIYQENQTISSVGLELVIVFDVSRSMYAEDVRPSRLEYAKAEVIQLVDKLPMDRVGIVAFAGAAVVLSPLTADKGALKMYLESLSPRMMSSQGTFIARALDESGKLLERGGDPLNRSAKVILLVSDGEDHEGGAIEQVEVLRKKGFRIYTAAIGTQEGARIPIRDRRGIVSNYLHDHQGNEVVSKVNFKFLRQIASEGGGEFFSERGLGFLSDAITRSLDRLDRDEFSEQVRIGVLEKYGWFLSLALFLSFLELFLRVRRRT